MPSSTNSTASPPAVAEPAPPAAAVPSRRRSLRALFLVAVATALVPVCVLSFVQAYARLERDREIVRSRLVESVQAVTSTEQNIFANAAHVLATLSTNPEIREAGPGCGDALRYVLTGLPFYSNIALVAPDGRIRCAALPMTGEVSLADEDWWPPLDWKKPISVAGPVFGKMSQRRVMLVARPLNGPNGDTEGLLALAVDLAWLDRALKDRAITPGAVVALVDATGRVVAASTGDALPAFAPAADPQNVTIASTQAANGRTWSYATAPLVPATLSVVFALPDDQLFDTTTWHISADVLLPLIAILLASLAIWLAAHRWVLRHVAELQELAAAYTKGEFEARSNLLGGAPAEIAALREGLHGMAERALDRDRKLQEALAQKALLVREVHHRVKNNLQIVVSLLSLQAGRLTDPETRAPLEQARTRISALALVHRLLLDMEDQSFVEMRYLLGELSANLRQAMGARSRGVELVCEAEELLLPTDTAIPLTLFTVEAVTNAFRHAFGTAGQGRVTLTLTASEGTATLSVADTGTGFDPPLVPSGTGMRLLRAFTQQLAGSLTIDAAPGRPSTILLVFPIPPKDGAVA